MNVSLQNIDEARAVLTVKIEKADYQEKADKALRRVRQKIQMPGFRVGKVPLNLAKKIYGTSVRAEEVNNLLGEAIYNYLKDNNVDILGEPLPDEEQQKQIDFEKQEDFEFVFGLALTPKFNIELSKDDHVTEYVVEVTDAMVDNRIAEIARQNGEYKDCDIYEDKALIRGQLTELDAEGAAKPDGIVEEEASLMPTYMKSDEQKALFAGAKVGDTIVFNPAQAWGEAGGSEIAALLHIDRKQADEMKSDFSCQITSISHYAPAEVNEDLYKKVYPAGDVTTDADFRARIAEQTASTFKFDTDYLFTRDLRKVLVAKAGEMKLADDLLKRFLSKKAKEKDEQPMGDDDYDKSREALIWDLVRNKIAADEGIKVEEADLTAAAEDVARTQFARYGMANVPAEMVTRYAKDMIDKGDVTNILMERALENKLIPVVREKISVEQKTIGEEALADLFK